MPQKLLYIISRAPLSVLFVHDGVFQLKSDQLQGSVRDVGNAIKQYTKTYKALADFGVDDLYCLSSSLVARGLDSSDLIANVVVLNEGNVAKLINDQFRVFVF